MVANAIDRVSCEPPNRKTCLIVFDGNQKCIQTEYVTRFASSHIYKPRTSCSTTAVFRIRIHSDVRRLAVIDDGITIIIYCARSALFFIKFLSEWFDVSAIAVCSNYYYPISQTQNTIKVHDFSRRCEHFDSGTQCNTKSETIFLRVRMVQTANGIVLASLDSVAYFGSHIFNFHLQHAYGRIWLFSYSRRFQNQTENTHTFWSLAIRQIKKILFSFRSNRVARRIRISRWLDQTHATCIFQHETNECRHKPETSAFLQRIGFWFSFEIHFCRECWMSEMKRGSAEFKPIVYPPLTMLGAFVWMWWLWTCRLFHMKIWKIFFNEIRIDSSHAGFTTQQCTHNYGTKKGLVRRVSRSFHRLN